MFLRAPQLPESHSGVRRERTERYKYLRYINSDPLCEELYDLKSDPNESNNLADDPKHEDLLKRMRKKWTDLHQQIR